MKWKIVARLVNFHLFVGTIMLLLGCVSFSPAVSLGSPQKHWTYANLRHLDPPDALEPAQDVIATYTRQVEGSLEIRLDFLEIDQRPAADVYITIDSLPGGAHTIKELDFPMDAKETPSWDVLLTLKVGAPPEAFNIDLQSIPALVTQTQWDWDMDCLFLRLDGSDIPGLARQSAFQVFITAPGTRSVVDWTIPFFLQGSPPVNRARVSLLFWDALPAKTPAQALRRWDGAHTGPLGQRHGLYHILTASAETDIPLILLDLKQESSIKALNYMGKMGFIRQLETRRLLFLPEVNSRERKILDASYQDSQENNLTQVVDIEQLDRQGITLALKRQLIRAAIAQRSDQILFLGGSLPSSLWAESSLALPALQYLASHPWIQPKDVYPWLSPTSPSGAFITDENSLLGLPENSSVSFSDLYYQLQLLPDGPLTRNARQYFRDITSPTENIQLRALRLNYVDHLQRLIVAAQWANKPKEYSDCDIQSDPEGCILSTEKSFNYFDKTDGRLVLSASITPQGVVQWIAPVSQLAIGLSDPSEWDQNGELSDPNEIPGAFADLPLATSGYHSNVESGKITFFRVDGSIQKIYSIQQGGLLFEYQATVPVNTRIPMIILPNSRYPTTEPETIYPSVTIRGAEFQITSSWDSFPWMGNPENPDFNYPPGHYLPFPLKIIQIKSHGNFSVFFYFE